MRLVPLLVATSALIAPRAPPRRPRARRAAPTDGGAPSDPLLLAAAPILPVLGRAMLPGARDVLHVWRPEWRAFFEAQLFARDEGAYVHVLSPRARVGVLMRVLDFEYLERARLKPTAERDAVLALDADAKWRAAMRAAAAPGGGEGGGGAAGGGDDAQRFEREFDGLLVAAQAVCKVRVDDRGLADGDRFRAATCRGAARVVSDDEIVAHCRRRAPAARAGGDAGAARASAERAAAAWSAAWSRYDCPRRLEARGWARRGLELVAPFSVGDPDGDARAASASARAAIERGSALSARDAAPAALDDAAAAAAAAAEVDENPELFAAEAEAWAELDLYAQLAARLRANGVYELPAAVRALRPAACDGAYSPLRRAWRLSYALAHVLDVEKGEGRQALLEHASTAARLRAGLEQLREQRKMMGGALALEGISRQMKGNK